MKVCNCAILLVILSLTGCFKKEEFTNYEFQELDPGWGVPLIDSRLELKDIVTVIDSSIGIRQDPDSSYTFYYFDTIRSKTAEELFQLPDQAFRSSAGAPLTISGPFPLGASVTDSITSSASNFDPGNGGKFNLIKLKGGTLNLDISSTFGQNVTVQVNLISLLDPSQKSFQKIYNLTPSQPSVSDLVSLPGYTVDLSPNAGESNIFKYSAVYTITSTGNHIIAGDSIIFNVGLNNLKYSLITGDIGQIPFQPYTGAIDLRVFDQSIAGDLYFQQAKLTFTFDNSFGVQDEITINKLQSRTAYGKVVDITPKAFNILVQAPTQPGSVKRTVSVLDSTNSKIVDAVNPAPNKLDYDFSSQSGAGSNNFILDKSVLNIYTQISIPLKGYIVNYALVDTINLKNLPERTFSDTHVSGSLDSAVFKLKTENYLPASALTQVYFLDSLYQVLDSLLIKPDDALASNFVNPATGEVTSPTIKETNTNMNGTRYDRLYNNAKYLKFYSRVITPKDSKGKNIYVRIRAYNYLRLVIAVLAKGKIKIQ